ncbi:YfhO family protein [Catalinimonas niigatensis]|uniref:YfhO family protein n=1 Tax=Catalinimonas niigatensis TaxID=1397264 RepID=UPI002666D2C6|nr:YfhO family protein [Catalinimonas niigatensis]WPP50495.1 YfhO family protein [Catalinimonas niigatensis]
MPKIDFKKQVLPHVVAVVFFLVVTILFFSPMFFQNQVIQQNDVLQGVSSGQEIIEYRERTGEEALWTNSMFSGMPAYLINIKYQGEQIIHFFQDVYSFGLPRQAEVIFKSILSFYILLLVFGVRPYLAVAGAIAYGLGTFNIVSLEAGHIWKIEAIAYMPLVLAGIHLTYRGKLLWGTTLTALALALELNSNHLQITYYLLLTVIIYGIAMLVDAIRNKNIAPFFTRSLLLVLAAVLAVGVNFARIWNTYQYGQYSTRGPSALTQAESNNNEGLDRDYVFAYSLNIAETFTLFIPDFSGGASNRNIGMNSNLAELLQGANYNRQQIQNFVSNAPTYWGGKISTSGPTYAGAVMVFLFFVGCFFAPQTHRIWLIVATVFSIMLTWGKYFPSLNYLLYDLLPGYNKFRTVEMAMVIALLCIPLLGLLGLEHLLKSEWNKVTKKRFFLAAEIPLGLALLLLVFAGAFGFEGPSDNRFLAQQGGEMFLEAIQDDRADLLRGDAFRSMILSLLAGALIFFFKQGKFAYIWLAAGIVVLSTFDLWAVGKRFLTEEDYVRERNQFAAMTATEADEYIMQQNEQKARVLNLMNPFNDALTSYFHSSIGGYHGAKLGRYQDLIDYHLSEEISSVIQSLQQGNTDFSNINVLNMLNARYFKAGDARNAVIINEHALGNAWLVGNIQEVNNADDAIEALGVTDLSNTAIVNTTDFSLEQSSYSQQGSIRLTSYEPNELVYQVDLPAESFAVFSEIYYPEGWLAYIDNEPVEHLRVNYILRGLPIPAGEHTIRFKFKPQSYYIGSSVSLVCSILLSLMLIVSIAMSARNIKQEA